MKCWASARLRECNIGCKRNSVSGLFETTQCVKCLNCEKRIKKCKKILKKLLTKPTYHCILTKSVATTATKWNLSSAGRASALQAEGHRFEPYRFHSNESWSYGEVAQLARACGSYPQCRGFKSLPRYEKSLEDDKSPRLFW